MRTYQPGQRDQAPAVTWRQWLLPLGAAAGIVALVALSPKAPQGTTLSYSRFLTDVGAGSVNAVTLNPAGQITGRLVTGQPFTTNIPVALGDRTLTGQLAAHHVQVTATASMPSSPVPLLIGLLLLVMIGGLFYVGVRGARRESAGLRGLTGVGELTRANTRISDAERRPARIRRPGPGRNQNRGAEGDLTRPPPAPRPRGSGPALSGLGIAVPRTAGALEEIGALGLDHPSWVRQLAAQRKSPKSDDGRSP